MNLYKLDLLDNINYFETFILTPIEMIPLIQFDFKSMSMSINRIY